MNVHEFSARQGLVLGFTAAEITILLLFLLLLIMGILHRNSEEVNDEPTEQSTSVEQSQDRIVVLLRDFDILRKQHIEVLKENEVFRFEKTNDELKIERIEYLRQLADDENLRLSQTAKKSDQQLQEANSRKEDLERELQSAYSRLNRFEHQQRLAEQKEQGWKDRLEQLTEDFDQRLEEVQSAHHARMERLRQENQVLKDQVAQQSDGQQLAEQEVQGWKDRLEQLTEDFDQRLEEVQSAHHARMERLRQENQVLKDQIAQQSDGQQLAEQEVQDWKDRLEQLTEAFDQRLQEIQSAHHAKTERLQQQNQTLNDQISASDSKGTNSACWFRESENSDGSVAERALYLFDIQILDNAVLVHYPSKSRNGFAENANFNRSDLNRIFNETLRFDWSVIGRPLRFREFLEEFQNFKIAGRNHQIREGQQCTFNVALWDHTSPNNKEGYLQAKEQTVDQIFSSYRYKDDPWPHG